MYPTLSMFGSLGSRYNSRANEITGVTYANDTIGKVIVGGVPYSVFAPFPDYSSRKQPFFPQLNKNFNQSIGLSLRIPIFNGLSTRTNYQKSKINIQSQELQKQLDNQTLKQDIYKAYNASMVAMEKLHAGKKTLETAERTLYYAQKRYDVGLMGTFELITNQNNLFRAKLENALNQFDYVFKMKVLEFYKGQGLKF
jgi:outer membrane protein